MLAYGETLAEARAQAAQEIAAWIDVCTGVSSPLHAVWATAGRGGAPGYRFAAVSARLRAGPAAKLSRGVNRPPGMPC
jgi:hypothetical protein